MTAHCIANCLLDGDETAKQFINRGAYRWHPIWQIKPQEVREILRILGFRVKRIYRSQQKAVHWYGSIIVSAIPLEGTPVDQESRKQWAYDTAALLKSELGIKGRAVDTYAHVEENGTLTIDITPTDLAQANYRGYTQAKDGEYYHAFPDRLITLHYKQLERERREVERRDRKYGRLPDDI
jgi:hypothetical protein